MSSVARNRKYLESLVAPLLLVPAEIVAEISVRIFSGLVELTAFDSGQAALNWHLQPYVGSVTFEQQQIMWGYAGLAPVSPAGYKWSGGRNEDQVKADLVMQQLEMLSDLRTLQFDGISVYNPIQPGFPGFAPGNDERYYEYALSDAEMQMASIVERAITEGTQSVVDRHSFLRGV